MVDVAQLVEHQIVALVVVGSTPTIHPIKILHFHLAKAQSLRYINSCFKIEIMSGHGAIGSALALGARGCQFESGCPDQSFVHFLKNDECLPTHFL